MIASLALLVPALALGSLAAHDASADSPASRRQQPTVNGTVEYATQCKSCPYDLCTNVNIPWYDDPVVLTCWTEGDLVGDTALWVKTTEECFIPEYDLIESIDFRSEIEWCGEVPLDITRQDATVRYLSECKWGPFTSEESMLYYGRDVDVELTCWSDGEEVVGNSFWYKTTDNCRVSGSGLWATPDRDDLEWCGPDPGPRANETRRSLDDDAAPPISRSAAVNADADAEVENGELGQGRDASSSSSLLRRWLQPEQIGEEYAPCRGCPTDTVNSTCRTRKRYEFNDTVVSQCIKHEYITFPNGSIADKRWMLTTDWCYVEGWYFWVPPWDNYRYPRCDYWEGY